MLSSWEKAAWPIALGWGLDGAYRDAAKILIAHATFRFYLILSAAVAAMLATMIDVPALANLQCALVSSKSDPRFQVLVGGTRGARLSSP